MRFSVFSLLSHISLGIYILIFWPRIWPPASAEVIRPFHLLFPGPDRTERNNNSSRIGISMTKLLTLEGGQITFHILAGLAASQLLETKEPPSAGLPDLSELLISHPDFSPSTFFDRKRLRRQKILEGIDFGQQELIFVILMKWR